MSKKLIATQRASSDRKGVRLSAATSTKSGGYGDAYGYGNAYGTADNYGSAYGDAYGYGDAHGYGDAYGYGDTRTKT